MQMLILSARCSSGLQPHTRHPPPNRATMRDHPVLGSAKIAPSLPVSGQTDSAANSNFPLFKRDHICSVGELSAVQKGGTVVSWEQRQ